MDPRYALMTLVYYAIRILSAIILIDAILTWFPSVDRYNPIVVTLRRITAPIYRPIRQILPAQRTGYIDFSPLIAILALQLIGRLLQAIILP